jgi:hypothetical protein
MTAETLRRSLQFFHCTECSCKAEEALSKSENTVGYSGIEFAVCATAMYFDVRSRRVNFWFRYSNYFVCQFDDYPGSEIKC